MKTRNTTVKLLALIALAIAMPQTSYPQGVRSKDVNVVNTPDVNVVNTPTVNLAARSVVGINPSSNTVQVASSSQEPVLTTQVLLVKDVFQKELEITLVPGDAQGSTSFTVPAGKLLVIDDVSGFAVMGADSIQQFPYALFKTTANNNLAGHFLVAQPFGAGFQIVTFGKSTIYADPGSTVELIFARSSFNTVGTAKLNMTFSGHYLSQ